jgi:DNA-binding MarR family transcriptional regulator
MDSSGRVDRTKFVQRSDTFLAHPAFQTAQARFCEDVTAHWLSSPLRRQLIADTGAMAVAITVTGLNRLDPVNGASLEILISGIEAAGLASGNRVRGIIDMLVHQGALQVHPHPHDRRRRRLVPTPVMHEDHQSWLASVLRPLSLLVALGTEAEELARRQRLAERYITSIMLRQAVDGFTIFEGWPEAIAFMDRRHGYLLLLMLAAHENRRVAVNRAHVARRFGVSPAHVAKMLADAEAMAWLSRTPHASIVELSADFAHRLDLWVARELAIVSLWLEAKGAIEAPPLNRVVQPRRMLL